MKLQLKNVRLAFPVLFEPKAMPGESEDKAAYSAALLLDPATHAEVIAEIEAAIEAIGQAKWTTKWPAVKKTLKGVCLVNGDTKADYTGFEGNMFVSTRTKKRPLVIDRNKEPLTAKDGRPYAGCYVNASIELWAQDNNFGKRINAEIKGVQFYRDGDAFAGGAPASADEFDDLAVEEESDLA